MTGDIAGVALLICAGIMNATFTLPMRYTRRWSWENTWLAWAVLALVMLPVVTTCATISHVRNIYERADPNILCDVIVFGAGWGVAQVLFGVAVDTIGIALTFSLVLGTATGAGALTPFILLHPERLGTPAGFGLLVGVSLVLVGVLVCALAGRQREMALKMPDSSHQNITVGLFLAILCGLGASLMNLGVAFGAPLIHSAVIFGAREVSAPYVVWMPFMLAGVIPNLLYCFWLLRKNGSTKNFRNGGTTHWILAVVMAALWFGSASLYGISIVHMGSWGPILGWPLFMSLIVIAASLLGTVTGEWRNSGRGPLRLQWMGVALLVFAVFVLALTSRYLS